MCGMFRRSATDRVLTGVAGGIGERLEIDPVIVRLAFVILTFAGGVGLLLYVAAALVSRKPDPDDPPPPPKTSTRQAVAIALVLTGVLLALRGIGLWLGDGVVWPAALVVLGSAVIWTRGDEATRAKWLARMPSWIREEDESRPRIRTLVGALVIALGAWAFLSSNPPLDLFDNAPLAVATVRRRVGGDRGSWVSGGSSGRPRTNGASGSARRSAPRWPRTCTIRCCRRSR